MATQQPAPIYVSLDVWDQLEGMTEAPAFDGFERIDYHRPVMTETEVNNLKKMCKTDPHLKGFVTEVTDEKQGASNQFQVTIATKKGARVFDSWSEFQQWRLGLAKIVL